NVYVYCNNNPVNLTDPTGEIAITTCILIGSAVAGLLAAGHTAAVSHKRTGKVDIIQTATAGLSTFMLIYSLGLSTYGVYETYSYCNGTTPVTNIGRNPAASPTEVIGKAHGSPEHRARINNHVSKMKDSGGYSKVYLNKSLKTAGLNGTQRPDIIGIDRAGTAHIWEFASKTQVPGMHAFNNLYLKMEEMAIANPSAIIRPLVPW
ncbi:MAG: hypothetical protein PHV03_11790, partial [Desulfitobacteriaceae bacterium]|nr:hypothetical protein [Desulfitobacteriaceae bacterium]MDD4403087.1 hypothetical protein [Desulfitobacteriaceae bacterium]